MSSEDDIGFGKPPKNSRFQPGQSGNPKGRPKGTKSFSTIVREVLDKKVRIRKDGKTYDVSSQEAGLIRLVEKALKGDARSLEKLLGLAQTYAVEDGQDRHNAPLKEEDAAILDRFAGEIRAEINSDQEVFDDDIQ